VLAEWSGNPIGDHIGLQMSLLDNVLQLQIDMRDDCRMEENLYEPERCCNDVRQMIRGARGPRHAILPRDHACSTGRREPESWPLSLK
jgi:hypothetical protein